MAADQQRAATWKALVAALSRDEALPADTRVALARTAMTTSDKKAIELRRAIDALLPIVRDRAAAVAGRRTAAFEIGLRLLPRKPKKKGAVNKDEYGFAVNPRIAHEYQDKGRELRRLRGSPSRDTPVIKKQIEKLEARIAAIQASFVHCRPESYGQAQRDADAERLVLLAGKEVDDGLELTAEEQEERTHLLARLGSFPLPGPGTRSD